METNSQIQLQQKPVIVHALIEVGQSVTKRLGDLNIENQIATEESVKSLKALRADLNKELDSFELQRKAVKEGVLNPYNEFEAVYKTEISDKYKAAIDTLKTKIAQVEDKIKEAKKNNVIAYFDELCHANEVDFIKFEQLDLKIDLSTSEKAYREKCNEFMLKVADDLALIKTHEYQAEILVEYKKTINASKAITEVVARKEAEKAEQARIKAEQFEKRVQALVALGMRVEQFAGCVYYNDDIYIRISDVEDLERDEFAKKYNAAKVAIETLQVQEAAARAVESPAELFTPTEDAYAAHNVPPTPQAVAAPPTITAPKIAINEEIVTASFQVTGTISQLRALGQFLKDNKIEYKNL